MLCVVLWECMRREEKRRTTTTQQHRDTITSPKKFGGERTKRDIKTIYDKEYKIHRTKRVRLTSFI